MPLHVHGVTAKIAYVLKSKLLEKFQEEVLFLGMPVDE